MKLKDYIGKVASSDLRAMGFIVQQIHTIGQADNLSKGIQEAIKISSKDLQHFSIAESFFDTALRYTMAKLGEDAKNLPDNIKSKYTAPWRKLHTIRNLVAHEVEHIWKMGQDGYFQKIDSIKFTEQEQLGFSNFMNDNLKSTDPLLRRISRNIFVAAELSELMTNHSQTGQQIADAYKGRQVFDPTQTHLLKENYITPPVDKYDLVDSMFLDLNFFNFTKLSESISLLSPMFMKLHGESEIAKNNIPDPSYTTKFRNHTLHNNLDGLSEAREKNPALIEAHANFGKAIVNLGKSIASYLGPYSSKNKVCINTESYMNTSIKIGADKKIQGTFSDIGSAKLNSIEKAINHFESLPDSERNQNLEQAYILSLAHINKSMSEKTFRELVNETHTKLDKLVSQIRPIDGTKAGFSTAEAGRRLGNYMIQCEGHKKHI